MTPTLPTELPCNCPCCREGIEAPHEYHLERRQMGAADAPDAKAAMLLKRLRQMIVDFRTVLDPFDAPAKVMWVTLAHMLGDIDEALARHAAAQLAAVAAPPEIRLPENQVRALMVIAQRWAGKDTADSRSDYLEMALRALRVAVPAAVAAPEARISLTDEQILTCLNSLSPPSGRWKGPREHNIAFARAIEAALRHPAAPGSSTPSAAPLSEPCALDQGARPVRPVDEWQYRWWWNGDGGEPMGWGDWKKVLPRSRISTVEDHVREIQDSIAQGHRYELRALYVGIAPPVAQPGSAK